MLVTDAGEMGRITTVTIICFVVAAFLFYLGLLELADAEERHNQNEREDWREREVERTPLHWPDVELDDPEQFIG